MDLPFDVLVSIFYFLNPLDIINYGKTCTSSYDVVSSRSVWTSAFLNACHENGIFTGPLKIDTLSLVELKHMSTCPQRMLNALQHAMNQGKTLRPVSSYSFNPLNFLATTVRPKIYHTVYLVPGGKYLVAISESHINVLDLARAKENVTDDVAASIPFHRGLLKSVSPTSSGDKIQIAASRQLVYSAAGNRKSVITVWEYDPDVRSLTEVISKPLDNTNHLDLTLSTLSGNLFIYLNKHEATLNVWNFVSDLWATILLPPDVLKSVEDVWYEKGKLILMACQSVKIWDLPEFSRQPQPSVAPQTLDIHFSRPPVRSPTISIRGLDTHRWGQNVDRGFPILYDMITQDSGSHQIELNPSHILPDSPEDAMQSPAYLNSFEDGTRSLRLIQRWQVKQRFCAGAIIRTWYSTPPSSYFQLSLLPRHDSGVESILPVRSIRSEEWQDYSFDPTSGRLCSVGYRGDINIVDYLSNPSQQPTGPWADPNFTELIDSSRDADEESSEEEI